MTTVVSGGDVLLQALAQSHTARPAHVWRALSVSDREVALRRCATERASARPEGKAGWRSLLIRIVLDGSRGFRPSTIRAWSLDQLSQHVAKLHDPGVPELIADVVLAHHNADVLARVQAPLMDRLEIRHVRGEVVDDALDDLATHTADEICSAALDAWRAVPTREMALYLLALAVVFPARWAALLTILPTVGEELQIGRVATQDQSRQALTLGHEDAETSAPSGVLTVEEADDDAPEDSDEFDEEKVSPSTQWPRTVRSEMAMLSALDEEVILRIADSLQDVVGAPSEERVDAIIDELIRLNATRHQTFYLRGFHDAVRRRADQRVLPAQNPSRWRWYMAGYVAGLARLEDPDAIVQLWERRPEARTLGDTGKGPSQYGVLHVVRALQSRERYTDAVAFASPDAVARSRALAEIILEIGTRLQRAQRLAEASPVFERLLLTEAIENQLPPDFWATVKRRHAHCLRSEGKLEAAQRLLEEALDEAEAGERAMITVDLGLIAAGYGRLADLRLPSSFDAASKIACGLDRGEDRFREAEALGVSTSSHAHYVLGMRELMRKRYSEAELLLSLAVSQFDLERDRYEPAQLLRRAHLHVAVARCANVESDASRLDQAMRDILDGLEEGMAVPDAFMEEVIAGLTLRDDVQSDALIERLLTANRDALLDSLRFDEKARRSSAVADALATRFRRPHRTQWQRMEDGTSLVRMLLLQARYEEASHALDELEELAVRSNEGQQFLTLLAEAEDSLTSVWENVDVSDSRVRVLESMGRYDEAAQVLRGSFARALAREDAQGRLDACDILEALVGYGCVETQELDGMRSRVARSTPVIQAPRVLHRSINILVVGGNEVQAQYDEAIVAHYRASAPWASVEFMHTGWSSNWGDKVDEFERRVVRADAVVLIYLMRTEFGRSIRKRMNGRPWRGCGGKGRDSIQRAIDDAIAAIRID
ncbi:MAG: hypothetical protein U0164_18000 [Gemmatimonadaceae bacterium]